jgi:zinc protease
LGETLLSISFSGLKDNADELLETLKDGLLTPEFAQDRLELVKTRLRNGIAHRNDDGAAIAQRELVTAIFGKRSPYGAQMEYANVDRINRGDLVAFHDRYFFPQNVTLALDGDFDPARMKEKVLALFGDWKSTQTASPTFPSAADAGSPGRYLAVKKDLAVAFFDAGEVSTQQLDKDNPALDILAGILGGGPHGRLTQLFRGNVDSVEVSSDPGFGHPGLFRVSGTVINPFLTPKVLRSLYDELNRVRVEQVSEEELKTAKATALNRLVFAYDNQLSLMPRLAEYRYFNFPADYSQQYQQALAAVTRADVLRVAREHLDPSKMTTIVVGNPTAFEVPLETLGGAVSTIDLTIAPPKEETGAGDAASRSRGRALLLRAQQAMGGSDKLAAVTDYTQDLSYRFAAGSGGAQAKMTERWISPTYLRQDTTQATGGKISVYCDGKIGWVATDQNSDALTGVQLQQVQSDIFRTLFTLILSDRTPSRKLNALDDRTVEIGDTDGHVAKLVFDPATGLLKDVLYSVSTASGPVSVLQSYSDYRSVAGIQIPFQATIDLSGKRFQDLTVNSMRMNTGLKVADLEKRP